MLRKSLFKENSKKMLDKIQILKDFSRKTKSKIQEQNYYNSKKLSNLVENCNSYYDQIDFDFIQQRGESPENIIMMKSALRKSSKKENDIGRKNFIKETMKEFMHKTTIKNMFMPNLKNELIKNKEKDNNVENKNVKIETYLD